MNEYGRNAASWPGYASTYWKETCIPHFGAFRKIGGDRTWPLRMLSRWVRTTGAKTYGTVALLLALGLWRRNAGFKDAVERFLKDAVSRVQSLIPQ
jgi:hypothetical protein